VTVSRAGLALATKGPGRLLLKIRVMVPVFLLKRLHRHAEPARGGPQVGAVLHGPGRRSVTQDMAHNVRFETGISKDPRPGRLDLSRERPAVRPVNDVADLSSGVTLGAESRLKLLIEPMPAPEMRS
jgi:hypothetical protein